MSELDLIVTVGGKPVDDQRLGIELFKARAQTGALEQQLTKLQAKYDAMQKVISKAHGRLARGYSLAAQAGLEKALKEQAVEHE